MADQKKWHFYQIKDQNNWSMVRLICKFWSLVIFKFRSPWAERCSIVFKHDQFGWYFDQSFLICLAGIIVQLTQHFWFVCHLHFISIKTMHLYLHFQTFPFPEKYQKNKIGFYKIYGGGVYKHVFLYRCINGNIPGGGRTWC